MTQQIVDGEVEITGRSAATASRLLRKMRPTRGRMPTPPDVASTVVRWVYLRELSAKYRAGRGRETCEVLMALDSFERREKSPCWVSRKYEVGVSLCRGCVSAQQAHQRYREISARLGACTRQLVRMGFRLRSVYHATIAAEGD